jgi:heptosyltransferase I
MNSKNNTSISICILRLSSIGDITHIIPIISTLKKSIINCDITWIIGKTEYELVKNLNDINFIVMDKNKTLDSLFGMHKFSKNIPFDIVLHMQKSLRSKLVGKMIKGKINVTFNDINTDNCHVMENFFSFLKKIDIKNKFLDWQTDSMLDMSYIEKINVNKFIPYAAINPFTSARVNNYREWDYDNYGTIAEYLFNEYSINTFFLGKVSKDKKDKFSEHIKSSSNIVNLINKTTLIEMLSVLSKCKFYIGPDSGALHMANMLSLPIIGLYATSNPLRTGPYLNQKYVINKYNEAMLKFLNKEKNDIKWGARVRDKDAMKLISLNDVKNKIKEVIKS